MTTEELQAHYRQQIAEDRQKLHTLDRQIFLIGGARLMVVLLGISFTYLQWGVVGVVLGIVCAAIVGLLALARLHDRLFRQKDFRLTSIQAAKDELAAIGYDFSAFDGAKERVSGAHAFGLDIDLFGERSLFQSLNRTVTPYGKGVLAEWFENPLTAAAEIRNRQHAIQELQAQDTLRHAFRVTGLLSPATDKDMQELRNFTQEPAFLLPRRRLWQALSWGYPLFWTVVVVLATLGYLPASLIALCIVVLYIAAESQKKKIDKLQHSLEKKMGIMRSFAALIRLIEEHPASATELRGLQRRLGADDRPVSELIRSLAQLLSNLDQRSGAVGRFVLNTLLLWDIRYTLKIEIWKDRYDAHLEQWMQAIGAYDATCSLATYAFNHPSYTYPTPTETYFSLQATDMGHPLMRPEVCVTNHIRIDQHPFFMIVTGANMAGKSTYLRTIGVNYALATVGAPVCATAFRFYPAQLVTSLRTSDSLNDNESYFFAELKRLKMIIDRLKSGEQLFIILDEILKGTNSIDKQRGSLALMRQLLTVDACGIIATHDLALGALQDEFPAHITNHRFEADIHNDELTFTYTLQPGIAENMNACFLMRKMGIIIE